MGGVERWQEHLAGHVQRVLRARARGRDFGGREHGFDPVAGHEQPAFHQIGAALAGPEVAPVQAEAARMGRRRHAA